VRWNLDLVNRWLTEGRPPTDSELETFRAHARDRAAEGIPGDVIPANFRRAARFAWGALLDAATDAERPALLDSADLLFEYVDRVSRIYFEESAAAAAFAAARGEESSARALLARIDAEQAPLPEDHQLADRIGFDLARASRAFVIGAAAFGRVPPRARRAASPEAGAGGVGRPPGRRAGDEPVAMARARARPQRGARPDRRGDPR
jgi:hypothetical protein